MKTIIQKLSALGLLAYTGLSNAAPCGGPGLPPCDVPEPSTLPLLIAGIVGGLVLARILKK